MLINYILSLNGQLKKGLLCCYWFWEYNFVAEIYLLNFFVRTSHGLINKQLKVSTADIFLKAANSRFNSWRRFENALHFDDIDPSKSKNL